MKLRTIGKFFGILLLCWPYWANAEQTVDLVRVLKSSHKLQLISAGTVLYEFDIALGSSPKGHKMKEGDGRTPEGKYTLDYKKADSAFHKAFHISYPNTQDINSAKSRGVNPGGQIMVHGQKNGLGWLSFLTQQFDWTNGCVAASNADIDLMWELVSEGTKIEIFP